MYLTSPSLRLIVEHHQRRHALSLGRNMVRTVVDAVRRGAADMADLAGVVVAHGGVTRPLLRVDTRQSRSPCPATVA
jgi:hypothetical protein